MEETAESQVQEPQGQPSPPQQPEKLQQLYNSLKANETIKGLPSDYNTFKAVMQDPVKARALHDALATNETVTGLPKDFDTFQNALGLKKKGQVSSDSHNGSSTSGTQSNISPQSNPNDPFAANALNVQATAAQANNELQANQAKPVKSPVGTLLNDMRSSIPLRPVNPNVYTKDQFDKAQKAGYTPFYDPDQQNMQKAWADAHPGQIMPSINPLDHGDIKTGQAKKPIGDKILGTLTPFYAGVAHGVADLANTVKDLDQAYMNLGVKAGILDAGQTQNAADRGDYLQGEFYKGANLGMDEQYLNNNPIHGLGQMVPMLLGGEANGAKIAGFGAWGAASHQVDQLQKAGVKFENGSDVLYKSGSALINYFLMKNVFGTSLFKAVGQDTFNGIVGAAAADATKELAEQGVNRTSQDYVNYYMQKSLALADKIKLLGVGAVTTYAKVGTDFAVANLATLHIKGMVNAINEQAFEPEFKDGKLTQYKEVFDIKGSDVADAIISPFYNGDTPANGSLSQFVQNIITTPAMAFSALHALQSTGMLFDKSPYLNPVIADLQKDHSPEAVASLKNQLGKYGDANGWSQDDIRHTVTMVDELADIAPKIPKDLHPAKYAEAVGLIISRRQMEGLLETAQKERANLDPSLQGKATSFEELLTANIEQANDRLNTLVTDKPFTYFEHQGEYFKVQQDEKPIKITKARYDLEGVANHRDSVGPESVVMPEGTADAKGNPIPPKDEQKTENKPVVEEPSAKPKELEPVAKVEPVKAAVEVPKEIEQKPDGDTKPLNTGDDSKRKYDLGTYYGENGHQYIIRSGNDEAGYVVQDRSTPNHDILTVPVEELDKVNLSKTKPIEIKDNAKPESPEADTPKANDHGKEETKGQGRQNVLTDGTAAAEHEQSPAVSFENGRIFNNGVDVGVFEHSKKENGDISIDKLYIKDNKQRLGLGKLLLKNIIDNNPGSEIIVYPSPKSQGFWQRYADRVNDDGDFVITKSSFYKNQSKNLITPNSGELKEELSPAESENESIKTETNPDNIAARYHTEESKADYVENGIMDYLGNGKINLRDYQRWGDKNAVGDHTDPKMLRWIDSTNSDRTDLAKHAEILSDQLGVAVTPEDFISFIDKYKGKAHFNEENKSDTQRLLESRFEELTESKLTPQRAEKAFNESYIVKRLNKFEEDNFNKAAKAIGITNEDVDNYEEYIRQTEPGRYNAGNTGTVQEKVSEPGNDGAGSNGKGQSDKETQDEPVGGREKAQQEYDEQKKAFDDFIKNSRKVAGAFANIGEFAIRAAKLLAAYAKLGIYKFADMLADLRKKYGDEFVDENIDGLKKAYELARVDVDPLDAEKFDSSNKVLSYTTETADLKVAMNKKKSFDSAAKNKTSPDELMGVFTAIDPRKLTPAEVKRYNEITDGKSVSQINRDEAALFIDDVYDRQDEDALQREKEWYKQVENDPDFEDKNIKKTLGDVAKLSGDETDLEETKPNETAKEALKKILAFGRTELRKTTAPAGMEAARQAMLDLDESKLSSRDLRDMNRAIEGMINDDNYAGSGKWIAKHESVKRAADILSAKNRAGYETGKTSRTASQIRSLPLNTEIMVKDSKLASVVQERSGIFDISAGNAKVNVTMNKVTKQFTDLIDKMPKDIQSVENRYKRGVLSLFTQQMENLTPEEHFTRYKGYVDQTVKRLLASEQGWISPLGFDEKKEGQLVRDIYNQHLKGANSSDDVVRSFAKENPNNLKVVQFFIDKHQEIYPQLRQSANLYSGKELPLIQNYTSTSMKRLIGADERPITAESIISPVSMDYDDKPKPTDTGQSRTTISRKSSMGNNRVMDLNFDALQLDRLRESHYDVQTLPSRHLYNAIRTQPDFKQALGNSNTNVNIMSEGVATMVQGQRGFNHTDPVSRMILNTADVATRAAIRLAIAGVDQFVKHYPSRAINTITKLNTDMDLYFKSASRINFNNPIFEQSAIYMRGLSKGGIDVESGMRNMRKYDFSTAGKAMNAMNKFYGGLDNIVGKSLTIADELVARHSWGAYYMQDLRNRGIDVDAIDWDNEYKAMDKEAAAYAEQMVSRNEIPNDPTQKAYFDQRGEVTDVKVLALELAKKAAMPFTTYSRNIMLKIEADVRKFYGGNKQEAAISLAATAAETAAFQSFKILLKYAIGAAAAAILLKSDYDAPKNEMDWSELAPETVNDALFAGTGTIMDNAIKAGLNSAWQITTGKPKNTLFKEYNPAIYGETNYSAWGMYGVLPQKFNNLEEAHEFSTGEIHGETEGKSQGRYYTQPWTTYLSHRQQNLGTAIFYLDLLNTVGISESTMQKMNVDIFNAMKRQSEPTYQHLETHRNKQSGSVKDGPKDFGDDN